MFVEVMLLTFFAFLAGKSLQTIALLKDKTLLCAQSEKNIFFQLI